MKQILIAAYILLVLMISGMAKAETHDLGPGGHIRRIEVDHNQGILKLEGTLPSPCYSKPTIVISALDPVANQIEFDVMAQVISEICSQQLGEDYKVSFDLKQLPLENGVTYQLKFAGLAVTIDYTPPKLHVVLKSVYAPSAWNLENFKIPVKSQIQDLQ